MEKQEYIDSIKEVMREKHCNMYVAMREVERTEKKIEEVLESNN